jgi:hypothetical protein
MDKKTLSERDICTKFITPAVEKSGWNTHTQLLEEVSFTDGKIYVRGKLTARGTQKRADYILYYKPNIPIAIIEAKDNKHSVRAGIQQALDYAQILDIPCVFSSNGDGFLFHDRTATDGNIETELDIDSFPIHKVTFLIYQSFQSQKVHMRYKTLVLLKKSWGISVFSRLLTIHHPFYTTPNAFQYWDKDNSPPVYLELFIDFINDFNQNGL